jgi:4-hydroxy-tetrahydrodipicolinate synthase
VIEGAAAELGERLHGRLIAATLTPHDDSGLDSGVFMGYLESLIEDGVEALAVAAHTGRGPYLTAAERDQVVTCARRFDVPVLVGVTEPEQAARAAALGADGVLVFPPPADGVGLHDAIWRAGRLPMIAFDLYLRPYEPQILQRIVAHPGVAGLKLARLHDAIACQRGIAVARTAGRLAITGEDRMFGASLMWGAQAALVGLAAASVATTADTLRAWREKRYDDFVEASARTDALAEATFKEPFDGYVQRMQWIAAAEGRIPPSCATDPYAPPLPGEEPA